MNCANHPDRERTAFCQNCGKPLCPECTRTRGASIFCEPCFAATAGTSAPPVGYPYPGPGYPPPGRPPIPPPAPGEPNPALAAMLGFIPGVGAMYNEQYGKGLVHLLVFAVLVSLAHDVGIFWLFVWGWIFYMVIEAHHTARARRDGTPLPNPFGLNEISERLGFGRAWPGHAPGSPRYGAPPSPDPAAPASPDVPPANPAAPPYSYTPPVAQWAVPPQDAYSYGIPPTPPSPPIPPVPPVPPVPPYADPNAPYYRRLPTGAIWLIVLGLFFLVGNTGIFHILPGRLFGPLLVIGVGVWIFVERMTSEGQGLENDGTAMYRWRLARALGGAAWVVLAGVIWLLDALRILRWSTSWPLFLIAGGVLLILKRTMYEYGAGYPPYPGTTAPPAAPVTTAGDASIEQAHVERAQFESTHDEAGNGQEGR